MFPKAHAAAYVMMAWRIAWFKINEPLAYYAAYFSIRSPGFDYELMCMGPEALKRHMEEYEAKDAGSVQPKEQEQYKAMKVVREMYARGYEFMKIDLSRCKATKMCVIDGKIMPCLNKIDGLGDNVAANITEAVKDGPFLSLDNFRERTGCPKMIVEKLVKFRILEGLPESNQLSIFDLMGTA
jgi:DNA polymerase-3 subunit alpha (Gram-positive type)